MNRTTTRGTSPHFLSTASAYPLPIHILLCDCTDTLFQLSNQALALTVTKKATTELHLATMRPHQQRMVAGRPLSQQDLRPVTVEFGPAILIAVVFFDGEAIAFDREAFVIPRMTMDMIKSPGDRKYLKAGERQYRPGTDQGKTKSDK